MCTGPVMRLVLEGTDDGSCSTGAYASVGRSFPKEGVALIIPCPTIEGGEECATVVGTAEGFVKLSGGRRAVEWVGRFS